MMGIRNVFAVFCCVCSFNIKLFIKIYIFIQIYILHLQSFFEINDISRSNPGLLKLFKLFVSSFAIQPLPTLSLSLSRAVSSVIFDPSPLSSTFLYRLYSL